ncbi:Spy/CpxP family protein refolding chaperone [Uruburuella testudinis]|uniref:Spy/CpxP family protein refolding chaperone n=1 Tax=Uruburuella testudinis TaxID=1282863 RepID=A0ABY4DSW9_9NEIS|nr:Spy/CpxP family protein refolding chaperone [Uruburuella testudinis]UOO81983.1 Spy/CpxP family protein refolding chaperone [Uruburuella testudinis]
MKKTAAISAAVLMGLALTACSADKPQRGSKHEQGMHKDFKRGGLPRDLRDLNLTDAQKAQIEQIMQQNRPQRGERPAPDAAEREQFRSRMEARRAAENSLLTNPTFDEAAARNLIAQGDQYQAQRQQRHNEAELQQLKTRHAVMQVLTPEQRQQWLAKQQQRQDARKNGRTPQDKPAQR